MNDQQHELQIGTATSAVLVSLLQTLVDKEILSNSEVRTLDQSGERSRASRVYRSVRRKHGFHPGRPPAEISGRRRRLAVPIRLCLEFDSISRDKSTRDILESILSAMLESTQVSIAADQ
jgi:hypothetical protein